MARRSVRTFHTTGAVLGATAMALVGAPAADAPEPDLRLLPLPSNHSDPLKAGAGIGGGVGGLAMGKSVLSPGILTPPAATSATTHTVKAGDTVWALAKQYNTTVAKIISANGLGSNAMIRIGQKLTIPGSGSPSTPKAPSSPSATKHTVKAGETLSAIAAKYSTTAAKIASANNLANPNLIRIGQVLTIPGSGGGKAPAPSKPSTPSAPKPAPSAGTYTVRPGDTVWGIAKSHNTTTTAIINANGLRSDGFIRVGQKLIIPAPGSSPSSPGAKPTPPPSNSCKDVVPNTFLHYTYPDDVVRAANENKCTLDSIQVPGREEMQRRVRQTALEMGVNPSLAQAVAFQESGFNHRAVSPANAIGTMQVIPSSGEWAGQMLGRTINLLDPNDNVAAGVAILRSLQRSFPTNLDYAIGAYYQGAGSVAKYGLASDTRNYVNAVKAHMNRFN